MLWSRPSPGTGTGSGKSGLIWAYNNYTDKENFFNHRGFSLRAGNYELEEQIKAGMTPEQIKATWQPGLDSFKQVRKKYLMYPDFE